MNHANFRRGGPIAVAVGFDEHTLKLVSIAADLCLRLKKTLCLLHVIEPWMEREYFEPLGEQSPLWNVTTAVETKARALALTRLDELESGLPKGIVVMKSVVTGKPAETLCREAQKMGSSLLLVGTGSSAGRHWFTGYSMALAVLATANVPVMAVGRESGMTLGRDRTKVLLADDLGKTASTALEFACDLAASLPDSELVHAHVCGVTPDALKVAVTTAIAASHSPAEPAAASTIHRQLLSSLRERLEGRANRFLGELGDAGCLYRAKVTSGNVFDEIKTMAETCGADVLVFGRHQAVHTDPFFLGRLSGKAMLHLGRTVIVVPTT